MKKILLGLALLGLTLPSRADEGMWLPILLGKNYDDMVKHGLKMSADQLYSVNNNSLKDAIVHFGGGCTGEIISSEGLLLTNHHCGFDQIATLSSLEKNYLRDGFWAKDKREEIPAPGLSVKFLVRMEDVTDVVMKNLKKAKGADFNEKLAAASKEIVDAATQGGRYEAEVKDLYNRNQYMLWVYEKFTDVRLVGTPPESLGKFGGDTDNWIWPRHTADFSMFRIYANRNNQPAAYAPDNVPYKPKHHLPVSIKGVNEGDYAMIFGYPGRTNRYETSMGVDLAINETNPSIVKLRDKRLSIMREQMEKSPAVDLKLSSLYARIANYWKYFIGQTEQLKHLKVEDTKKQQEQAFLDWAKRNKKKEYLNLFTEFKAAYDAYKPYNKISWYQREGFYASKLSSLASMFDSVDSLLAQPNYDKAKLQKKLDAIKGARARMYKEFDWTTEQNIFAAMTSMYYKDVPENQHPDVYKNVIFKKYGNSDWNKTFSDYAQDVFQTTMLLDSAKFAQFMANPSKAAVDNDPAIQYALSFVHNYTANYDAKVKAFNETNKELSSKYVKGLTEMNKDKLMYPDANSTMRVTYGNVKAYQPKDATFYSYFTTIDGVMEKYKPGDAEFDVPVKLIDLYKKKDFGQYVDAKDNNLHTCFITNNDITGGNSGSPVINAQGELIGCAFDGNWEAMSGDIFFDPKYKRTIVADIRYILFLIDKYGEAYNLINEMDIKK